MSVVIEELLPSPFLNEEIISKQFAVQYRKISSMVKYLLQKTIIPVIKKEPETIFTREEINQFREASTRITRFLQQNTRRETLNDLTLDVFQSLLNQIEKSKFLYDEEKEIAKYTTEIVIEYYSFFQKEFENRKESVEKILDTINSDDLKNSLYGVLLASTCMTIMINSEKYYYHKRLSAILSLGFTHAENLKNYRDTVDVLLNPESIVNLNQEKKNVIIQNDEEKEFIEIDHENIEVGESYLIQYQNKQYMVKKIDPNHIAFYDVQ